MQNDRFREKRYGNWMKVSLSLVYMKQSLEDFTDEEIKNLHSSIKTLLLQKGCLLIPPGNLCAQRCSAKNIKTKGNGKQKKWELCPPCRFKLCNKWLDMIIAQHAHKPCPKDPWENTDPQLWPVNPWEIAKVYLPYGCEDHKSSTDADAAALLTLMMNCTHFHPLFQNQQLLQRIKDIRNRTMHTNDMLVEDQDMLADITDILQLLRDPIHFGKQLPCQEAVNKIEQLRDNKIDLSLNRELELKALMQRTTTIQTDLLTMKKEQNSIRDSVSALISANESRKTECGELKQKIERLEEMEMKVKKVEKDIKHFQDFMKITGPEFDLIRNILQKHETVILSISNDILCHATTLKKHDICIRKYANILKRHKKELVLLKTKQNIQHIQHNLLKQEQIKLKTKQVKYDNKFKSIETKQFTLEAEQCRVDATQAEHTVEIDAIKGELGTDKTTFDLKKIQNDLCELFRTDHRAQSTISPYDPEDVVNIEDIYTELYLIDIPKSNDKPIFEKSDKDEADERTVRKQSAFYMHELRYKEGKKIDNLDDILVCDEKEFPRVVVQGDAGCGKTTWCNKIVQEWVTIHNPKSKPKHTDQPDGNTSRDKFISQLSLVFPLSLSGLSANLNFEQTLKELVFGIDSNIDFKGLKRYVFDNPSEVLFLLDGYDECNVTRGFVNDLIEHRISGLHDACVIVTSRPWKVEGLARKKHIKQIIEVRGFDDDNVPLYIGRYMETTRKFETDSSLLCGRLIENLIRTNMFHLAKIPMLLNMICHLFEIGQLEAKTYTGIYMCMLNVYIKRFETKTNLFNVQEQRTETLIAQLGKFAWQTLISADPEENSLMFDASKVISYISEECLKICQNIGLISKSRTFSSRSRIVTMSFPHRSMHEFLSAIYLSKSDQGNDEVKRYVESVFVGDRDVYKIANTLLFVCGLSRNTGISMLNQLKDHACITGKQLSTHFLLSCCREIYNKDKKQTHVKIEGIKTVSFTNFGKLEQSLVDLCKTSIENVRVVRMVDSEVQIDLNDLKIISVLSFENCEIKIQPQLSNSLTKVVLNSVFMSPITWRMFLRQLSLCQFLTRLQIHLCVDKSDLRQTHFNSIYDAMDDKEVNYMSISYSSFTSTKFIFPQNEHITKCRLLESQFRTEHSDVGDSVQNLHSLRTLHIEDCSNDNIRIPKIDTLKTLNIKCKQKDTELNDFLESINKCKALSTIHCQVQKQYAFSFNRTNIPSLPLSTHTPFRDSTTQCSTFELTDGLFENSFETEKLEIINALFKFDILSTTNLFSNLLEIDLVNCAFDVSVLRFPDESKLKTIKLTNTTMTVEGCSSIFESIGRMQHLTYCRFDRVTARKQDENNLVPNYTNLYYERDTENGNNSNVILIKCDFSTAFVRLPYLATEYDLKIDSVKMNGESWKHLFTENECHNLRSILIKTCNIKECDFQFVNNNIDKFILCDAVLSQNLCESMFKMLEKQNKMSICHMSDVSVGKDSKISSQYQLRSAHRYVNAHGYVMENCNFDQSNVILTSFGRANSLKIESVNMSKASWEKFFKHAKSESIITIQANKLTNIQLSISGLKSLNRVSGTNLHCECLDLPQSVRNVYFIDCVFDCKISFPCLCEQITLTGVHFGSTADLQATIDSMDKINEKLHIHFTRMNLKDVRFQIISFSHVVTLDSVEFSDSNQLNASELCVINTEIQNKILLTGNLEILTFENNTIPEVYNVFSKCLIDCQTIHTISFRNCDLSSFNNKAMLPKLVSLTELILDKVKMKPKNWQSFLEALSNSKNLNHIMITRSTVAQWPEQKGNAHIYETIVTFKLYHCLFKDTFVALPFLPSITVLSICDIEMGPQYWIGFIESFIHFLSLESVAINNCYIAEGCIVIFPILKELKSLRLENVVMTSESWSNMFASIYKSKLLHELGLYTCTSAGVRTYSIFSYGKKPQGIEIIDCDLQTADVYLPNTIKFETITIERTVLTSSGWATLLKSLAPFKNLANLNISVCKITASPMDMLTDIPTSVKQIALSYVSMLPENWEILFSSFSELGNLQDLEIRHCNDRVSENFRNAGSLHFGQKLTSSNCCIRILVQKSKFQLRVQRTLWYSLNELKTSKFVDIENGTDGNINYPHINDCRNVLYEEGHTVIPNSIDMISASTEHITLQNCGTFDNYQLDRQTNLTSLSVVTPNKHQMKILNRLLRNINKLITLELTGIVLKENIDLTNMTLLQHLKLDDIVMPGKSWSATLASINTMSKVLSVSVNRAALKDNTCMRSGIYESKSMVSCKGFEMLNCDLRDNDIKVYAITNPHRVQFKHVYLNKESWQRIIPSLQTAEVGIESCNVEISETGLGDNEALTSLSLRRFTMPNSSVSSIIALLCTKPAIESVELTGLNNLDTNSSSDYCDSDYKVKRKLSLNYCNLSNVVINEFPKFNSIRVVQIVNCKLTGAQWDSLFKSMEFLLFLYDISIETCVIDKCTPMFPVSCSVKCVKFTNVIITSHVGWSKLISSSQHLTTLQRFYLLECSHIKRKQAVHRQAKYYNKWAFSEPFTKFMVVDSEFNEIGIHLPVSETFSDLCIDQVRMTDTGWDQFINSLENVKQLKTIYFKRMSFKRSNNTTPTACVSIPVLELLSKVFAKNYSRTTYRYGLSISQSTIDKDAIHSLRKIFQEVSEIELHEIVIENDEADILMSEISKCKYLSKFVISSQSEIDARVDLGVYNFHGSVFVPPQVINADRISIQDSFSYTESVKQLLDNIFKHQSKVSYLTLHLPENGPVFQFPNDVAIESMLIIFGRCLKMPKLNNMLHLQSLQIDFIHFTSNINIKNIVFDWTVFVTEINKLPSLHTLIFSNCLFPKKCRLMPIAVKTLTKLKYDSPRSDDEFVDETLLKPIKGLNALCSLDLVNVKFSTSSTIDMSLLKNIVSLSIVQYAFKFITTSSEDQIFDSLIGRGILEHLEVGWEHLRTISSLSTDRALKSLCLACGAFWKENLNELEGILIKYEALNSIFFGQCSFWNISLNFINLPNMTKITLFNVKMNKPGWEVFCSNISNTQAIRSILISHCYCLTDQSRDSTIYMVGSQVVLSNHWDQKYSEYNLNVEELIENGIVIVDSLLFDSDIVIPRLPNLERVTLFNVSMVASSWSSCISSLSHLLGLNTVSLNYCSIPKKSYLSMDKTRKIITALQDNYLSISNCDFGQINFSFPQLRDFKNILVQFSDYDIITDSGLASLINLTSLTIIHLKHQVFPNPTPKIPDLPSLKTVEFSHVTWNRKVDLSDEMMSLNRECSLKPPSEKHPCGCISALYSR